MASISFLLKKQKKYVKLLNEFEDLCERLKELEKDVSRNYRGHVNEDNKNVFVPIFDDNYPNMIFFNVASVNIFCKFTQYIDKGVLIFGYYYRQNNEEIETCTGHLYFDDSGNYYLKYEENALLHSPHEFEFYYETFFRMISETINNYYNKLKEDCNLE